MISLSGEHILDRLNPVVFCRIENSLLSGRNEVLEPVRDNERAVRGKAPSNSNKGAIPGAIWLGLRQVGAWTLDIAAPPRCGLCDPRNPRSHFWAFWA